MQVGRRSSTAMCLPHFNPRPEQRTPGKSPASFRAKNLEPYHPPVSHSGQCRGPKGFPKQITVMQIRHPHELYPRPRETLAG